jgi:H+/Cl- antiporter ClcA
VRAETLATLCALLVGKYVFTALCFGSGAPGGTLFPLVVMGALIDVGCRDIVFAQESLRMSDLRHNGSDRMDMP